MNSKFHIDVLVSGYVNDLTLPQETGEDARRAAGEGEEGAGEGQQAHHGRARPRRGEQT